MAVNLPSVPRTHTLSNRDADKPSTWLTDTRISFSTSLSLTQYTDKFLKLIVHPPVSSTFSFHLSVFPLPNISLSLSKPFFSHSTIYIYIFCWQLLSWWRDEHQTCTSTFTRYVSLALVFKCPLLAHLFDFFSSLNLFVSLSLLCFLLCLAVSLSFKLNCPSFVDVFFFFFWAWVTWEPTT